ncbi:hypothetical protein KR009_001156 [Drosophila setifemur]|nr:hypothetical protein KR009_001156 [Drosophila setifemur]
MSSGSPIFYNADAVRQHLSWPLVNEAVESALKAVVKSQDQQDSKGPAPSFVVQPKRSFTTMGEKRGVLLTMPAFVGNYTTSLEGCGKEQPRSTLACKLVTAFGGNPQRNPPLPSVQAHVLLFNQDTGELSAIMDGTDLTTWRTVSASLVATKYLYFRRFGDGSEKDREINVAIVGCGVQGQLHASAFCENFRVKHLNLYNRSEAKARQLADDLQRELPLDSRSRTHISVCQSVKEACQDSDVICVATFANEPIILAEYLKSGSVHINAVGAGESHFAEVSPDLYRQAEVYVDCYANAEAELVGFPTSITAEVGAIILNGNYPEQKAVTVFQSMGEF